MGRRYTVGRVRQEASSTPYLNLPSCLPRNVRTKAISSNHGAHPAMQSFEMPQTVG
jgi:hypothetical protein